MFIKRQSRTTIDAAFAPLLNCAKSMCRLLSTLIIGGCLWGAASPLACAGEHHSLWAVKGDHNTVYLMGSVHMLRSSDKALPTVVLDAYERSKTLVMELDPANMGADLLTEKAVGYQMLPEGQDLAGALGQELYAEFKKYAQPHGIDIEWMSHFQPWFAALTVQLFSYTKLGMDPDAGVEMQFMQKAQTDHKRIIALETAEQQLKIFAEMSLQEQRQFLKSVMREGDSLGPQLDKLILAWQDGDTRVLESLLMIDAKESPELFRRTITQRNLQWVPKLVELLHGKEDCMVIVGTFHLIGGVGVPELLRQKGYSVTQL